MQSYILPYQSIQFLPVAFVVLFPLQILAQDRLETSSDQEEQINQEETPPQISPQNYEVVVEDSVSYRPSLNTVVTKFPTSLQATPASVGVVTAPL